jgi:hypothetical protein
MKQMKTFSALAAGSVAIALLLGTSLAQAEEQVCITEQTVTAIKGLEVTLDNLDVIVIDVDFIWTTGFTIYGSNLDNLPFGETTGEEDAFATMSAINQTLSAEQNIPAFAGQDNKNAYYIGAEVETEPDVGAGATAGWSGANYQFNVEKWERCEHDLTDNCVGIGSMILAASDHFVYADLKRAVDGATCDGSKPPPESSTTITPGFSGSWFDETRNGEGFNIEIGGPELDPYLLTYFYTYDKSGNQMWLNGFAYINDSDTVVVSMQVTSGAVFGDDFDPDDVIYEPWGTVTFKFSSCSEGTAEYDSDEFGDGTFNLVHLTGIAGLTCP